MNETIFLDIEDDEKFAKFEEAYNQALLEDEFNITKFFKEYKEKQNEKA